MKFWKMSGSGNDFVFVDGIADPAGAAQAADPNRIREISAAHTGVGADGVAILQPSDSKDFRLAYFNRDGSLGELCGNASLCAVRLGAMLGYADPSRVSFETDSGTVSGRLVQGRPEVELQPVEGLRADAGIPRIAGEEAIGFARVGVPHLVVLISDINSAPLGERGPFLRAHPSLPDGANVNWVAPDAAGRWRMRTFERGVEAETLACGTGAVATAALLRAWAKSGDRCDLVTSSGRVLSVSFRVSGDLLQPTLAGEGRVVFEGVLAAS